MPHGIEFHGQNRRIMCEMLKQAALFGQQSVQHRFAVMLVTRPDDVMVGARDDADRIELDKSELAHDRQDVRFSDRGRRQSLRIEPEPPCLAIVYPDWQRSVSQGAMTGHRHGGDIRRPSCRSRGCGESRRLRQRVPRPLPASLRHRWTSPRSHRNGSCAPLPGTYPRHSRCFLRHAF